MYNVKYNYNDVRLFSIMSTIKDEEELYQKLEKSLNNNYVLCTHKET